MGRLKILFFILNWAAALFFLLLQPVQAAEASEGAGKLWSGDAEVGLVATRGNTDTDTLNTKLKLTYERDKWKHAGGATFLYANDSGETTAQRFVLSTKSAYAPAKTYYFFATLRYEDDRFSGYDYRIIETIGYGRHVFLGPVTVALEAGPGGRHSKLTDGTRTDELLFRASGNALWEISKTSKLTEEVTFESGEEGSVTESVTALSARINSDLSMKVTLELRHNSKVPEGIMHTDTTTSVTLVYSF